MIAYTQVITESFLASYPAIKAMNANPMKGMIFSEVQIPWDNIIGWEVGAHRRSGTLLK